MRWHLTEDLDGFLAQAGDFLRSRPALHTSQLTRIEKLRTQEEKGTVFGRLEQEGEVRAIFYRRPSQRLILTAAAPEQADALAASLAGLGHPLSGVTADHDSSSAFAEAWRQCTGATAVPDVRVRTEVISWCAEFAAAVGEAAMDAEAWAVSRFGDKHFTFWETEEPVAMAGSTPMVAGMVRVDPVYTPARATDVVLYTDPANTTSNALYRRIGHVPIADFTGYDFA
ncbi:GNAT family N-acetyltransferase [Amycolatopsis sp. NPDC051758]|uniref:GNAT family N-acetyltransferase n=1 Tax=Amycolatopsis sp. NPDC051758 TaxID=3363935 RepID=UPI003796B2A0